MKFHEKTGREFLIEINKDKIHKNWEPPICAHCGFRPGKLQLLQTWKPDILHVPNLCQNLVFPQSYPGAKANAEQCDILKDWI